MLLSLIGMVGRTVYHAGIYSMRDLGLEELELANCFIHYHYMRASHLEDVAEIICLPLFC